MKKSAKAKSTPKKAKTSAPPTLEKKLSDVKERMNVIAEGNDPRYHLR
jgi:hypothetical protein